MSFGYYDKDWVDPPDPPEYRGTCGQCVRFRACPCGCGTGICATVDEWVSEDDGCEEGDYLDPRDAEDEGPEWDEDEREELEDWEGEEED